jgi:1,4-dihydroxy-2-naphthoate octaprenyltransferase
MNIFRLSRPVYLVCAILTYSLGAGVARYLGASIQWPVFLFGLLSVLPLLAASSLLTEYFLMSLTFLASDETPLQRGKYRTHLLQASLVNLTISGAFVIALLLVGAFNLNAGFLLALIALLLVAYAVPPIFLYKVGLGELTMAVVFATFLPAFSYFLQTNEFHRLLPLSAFPLTLLAIAWLLAANFSSFSSDKKVGRHSLLILLSWQRTVPLHHVFIIAAFLLFAISPFLGVSWRLIWPVFLALPFSVLQIFWLQRIANGGAPIWKFFNVLIPSVFGLNVYLLAMAFWLR